MHIIQHEMHYTNEVDMPDAASFNIRAGYRDKGLIAEAVFDHWNTLGGFDITRNNMPFPSNEMDMSRIGFNFKYDMPFHPPLSINRKCDDNNFRKKCWTGNRVQCRNILCI